MLDAISNDASRRSRRRLDRRTRRRPPRVVAGGPRPAAYSGTVSGRRLALNVEVEQTAIGPFELQQGQKGTFEPCNF